MPTVRVINENEEQVGIMALEKALALAKEQELDLVEVAPNARPPVCKILDFGKFLYHQQKLEQKHKKAQKQAEVKAIRLSIRTDTHDLEVKANKAKEFLGERNLVKVQLMMRGRENAHVDLARDKMKKFVEMIGEAGKLEEFPKKQGNSLIMIITPP